MPDLTRKIAITRHVAVAIVHDAGLDLNMKQTGCTNVSIFLISTCWSKGLNVEIFGLGG